MHYYFITSALLALSALASAGPPSHKIPYALTAICPPHFRTKGDKCSGKYARACAEDLKHIVSCLASDVQVPVCTRLMLCDRSVLLREWRMEAKRKLWQGVCL